MKRLAGLILLTTLLAACAPPGAGGPAGGGGGGPIKVGLLAPTTGTPAASGADMLNGWNLYWKVNGARIGNRDVETFHEDTAGDPNTALTKARQLVEQRGVSMLLGPLLANEGLAVADFIKTTNIPQFLPVVSADDLTQRQRIDNVIRIAGWSSSQPHHPFGEWAYEQGYRNVLTICSDYAFGHEVCGGFVRTFTARGGRIVGQLWNPLGTPDYSSYIAQMQGANADAVFALGVGADSPRFVRQYNEFGLKGRLPLLGGEVLLDQSLLRGMGPEAEGLISAGHFAEGRPERGTQEFVDLYLQEYNQLPSYYATGLYAAAGWVAAAVEKNGGNVEDSKRLIDAVKSISLDDSALGPVKLDDYNNPIQNIYIRRVERRPDGRLWNVPIKTYENVSQFWTFSPEEFLKQPVYSRSFQGLPEQIKQ
jgi:branched-chain amino acid transport system substrate-binding protein